MCKNCTHPEPGEEWQVVAIVLGCIAGMLTILFAAVWCYDSGRRNLDIETAGQLRTEGVDYIVMVTGHFCPKSDTAARPQQERKGVQIGGTSGGTPPFVEDTTVAHI